MFFGVWLDDFTKNSVAPSLTFETHHFLVRIVFWVVSAFAFCSGLIFNRKLREIFRYFFCTIVHVWLCWGGVCVYVRVCVCACVRVCVRVVKLSIP